MPAFGKRTGLVVGFVLASTALGFAYYLGRENRTRFQPADGELLDAFVEARQNDPRSSAYGKLTFWWDAVPKSVTDNCPRFESPSNVHPADYAGPLACRNCHQKNYDLWSKHAHSRMNLKAGDGTVVGDFSGQKSISYLHGTAEFFKHEGQHRMRLSRAGVRRLYRVNQTIGSRFFQYYVGILLDGPEPTTHPSRTVDHVLPFGWWISQRQWVPVVHVEDEQPDDKRPDPFAYPATTFFADYSVGCSYCHSTFPLGDTLLRQPRVIGRHAPRPLHVHTPGYVQDVYPHLLKGHERSAAVSDGEVRDIDREIYLETSRRKHAVSWGISCEACHLGAKAHADGKQKTPRFFPTGPHLFAETGGKPIDFGRTTENVNWACGRCHAGGRPKLAGGMSTWNSVEYTDALLGGCYTKLTCIHCHEPHTAIGRKWTRTPEADDASCLKCHQKYEPVAARQEHTHHPAGTAGSRCMNCHMPRLNEGLETIVRTHTIFSPTRKDMLEANHPNACNLCHLDKPIDWTLDHLESWYGAKFDRAKFAAYPDRKGKVGSGWIKSRNEAVRLIAADAIARQKADWALAELLDMLDDPYLINRQFSGRLVEDMLGVKLIDFGYRFYMTPEERREPLRKLSAKLLKPD